MMQEDRNGKSPAFQIRIYRSADDGNELALLMDASDLGKAKEFAASTGRKAAMEKAGVIGTPTDYFAE